MHCIKSNRIFLCFAVVCSIMVETASALVMHPGDDKRKAYPIPVDIGSFGMRLEAERPWHIVKSKILDKDKISLWKKITTTFYFVSCAHAPEEYVIVKGWLGKRGKGRAALPSFLVTSPAIDLAWDSSLGQASEENKEESVPAALLLTNDTSKHGRLILNPAKDRSHDIARRVQLTWDNQNYIRVWKQEENGESLVTSGTTLYLNGPVSLRIEPRFVTWNLIHFTAQGVEDDYEGDRVEDHVSAFIYDLKLVCVKFNHNTSSASSDGINLRRNYSQTYDISNGEWTATQGCLAPACYKTNQSVVVKARFKTTSELLKSVSIRATNSTALANCCIKGLMPTTVHFSSGETEDIAFNIVGKTPSSIAVFEQENWNWFYGSVNGNSTMPEESLATSGPHKFYVIMSDPVTPWSNAYGSNCNAWTDALDFSCTWASGNISQDEVATSVTRAINGNEILVYDVFGGNPGYMNSGKICFTDFLMHLKRLRYDWKMVNCVDCANFVMLFSNIVGCELFTSIMGYNFQTRPCVLIGRNQWDAYEFLFHEVAWSGQCGDSDYIYDACLKYNGAANPADVPRVAVLPTGVVFSDGNPQAPFVYRERLTPEGFNGYNKCQAVPTEKKRRSFR